MLIDEELAHPAPLVSVTGVSGGLGASTAAAALARALGRRVRPSVLVDLDLRGGGLDVTCGVDHLDGIRWGDLVRVRGRVDPERLADSLPGPPECKVLSAGAARGSAPEADPEFVTRSDSFVPDVLTSLRRGRRLVVVDAPRYEQSAALAPTDPRRPTVCLLLTGTAIRQLADLDAYLRVLEERRAFAEDPFVDCVLVTCGPVPRATVREALTEHTGIPVIGHLTHRREVARLTERGEWPRGPEFVAVAHELARRLPEVRVAA